MDVSSDQKKANFELLYKELQPKLYAYSLKFVHDPETARDLVQDAFIKLWEDVDFSAIHTCISAYLRKTVHNLCLLHIRDRQIHQRYEDYATYKLKEAELNFFSPDYGNYSSIFLKDIEDIVEKCLKNLPPQSRRIFEMSRVKGMSNIDIANELSLSVRTVENHMYRSLAVLKTELKDYLTAYLWILLLINS